MSSPHNILQSKQLFRSYNDDWENAYFDEHSGGYVVIHKQRIEQSKRSKNEKIKFNKELEMSLVFAKHGHQIELLEEVSRIPSPDVKINGIPADLKRVSSHRNIVREAKNALRKQGAEIVLFEFKTMTGKIHEELNKLKKKGIKVRYFITEDKKVIIEA